MAMFKGVKDQITVPVTVELLEDNNRVSKVRFRATFEKLGATRVNELEERERAGFETVEGLVTDHIRGWDDLAGEDGELIPYTNDNLAKALDIVAYRTALYQAFLRAQFDRKANNTKN